MAGDIRRPTRFDRKDDGHAAFAIKEWKDSKHKRTYMGEWHTHPGMSSDPSGIDRNEWGDLVKENGVPMVFVIANESGAWVGVGTTVRGLISTTPL
jgi:integrative and conjugative element protein (TIGR02256 family)